MAFTTPQTLSPPSSTRTRCLRTSPSSGRHLQPAGRAHVEWCGRLRHHCALACRLDSPGWRGHWFLDGLRAAHRRHRVESRYVVSGPPASSSHTLIGSIIGVGLANQFIAGDISAGSGVDWGQAAKVGYSLLLSPLIGFGCAALLLLTLKIVARNPQLTRRRKATPLRRHGYGHRSS